ncbi:MAG: carbohydrate porin, partial [Alphaproteobacteria bacterium]|nr:carbohydrate porin [Alphaproteobacteria bacterium]
MAGRLSALTALTLAGLCSLGTRAYAEGTWSVRGQATFVFQYHPAFHAAYSGPNSLSPASLGDETFDATAFLGARLWHGGSVHADPEIDQGFGLSNTLGVAGFPSGEAYKVGQATPYLRLQRLFFRQTFTFGRADTLEAPAPSTVANPPDKLVVTLGKFAVT